MTTYTNYMTVHKGSFAHHNRISEAPKPGMKERISILVYPVLGCAGIIYQLYLLVTG